MMQKHRRRAGFLAGIMAANLLTPAWGAVQIGPQRVPGIQTGSYEAASASDWASVSDWASASDWEEIQIEDDRVQAEALMPATPSDTKKDWRADMPPVGSEAFTDWFFLHTDSDSLWEWAFACLESGEEEFLTWYTAHEERILAAYELYSGTRLMGAETGSLWENWNGTMELPGDGTKEAPYQISSLAQLMGVSEAVASGIDDYRGEYLELTQDIDLGGIEINAGNWNPIGWYQNREELGGEVSHPFRGHFDGAGHTISGLKIVNPAYELCNLGLFGVIEGGSVEHLTVEADSVIGSENVAVLAGCLKKDAVIRDVTVSGYVHSTEDAGGIAAEVTGEKQAVIENCRADGIAINSEGVSSYVGGIAGNVQRACLVDNITLTQNGDSNRIQGKGYVGGIAGRMNQTQIFNSYVDGTIGGNGSRAAGGIVGKYESGSMVLARMAGEISRTNQGAAAREGTFVGTRETRHSFTYGTEKNSSFSYLYTNSASKAKRAVGSGIDDDNVFTRAAHIGYWTDQERRYVTVAGITELSGEGRYFYEELEDGVRYLVSSKLEREFTSSGYYQDLPFRLDHFAPGYLGEPVRGFLVSVPRIDTRNANGTYDTDVASLSAMPSVNSTYYRTIDQNYAAAVAPGAAVTVVTAPKNTALGRYQMVVSGDAGGVKPPTYVNEEGEREPMQYVAGGTYTFLMPECDTELNVEYQKVTTALSMSPEQTVLRVTHTRSGDRKRPQTMTEVHNEDGVLIARYLNGKPDSSVQVQPVAIHAEHNGTGETVDRSVRWSIDDPGLLHGQMESGYTEKDAQILPNLESDFIQEILERKLQQQADNAYQERIDNTIYTRPAVVTAATNPDTSSNGQSVYGNCKVTVSFQIQDHTTLRVEGLLLDREKVSFTVTRRLWGDRLCPQERYEYSEPVMLTASLYPERPFYKNVSWNDGTGRLVKLCPSGANTQECRLELVFDPEGKENPAWLQNVIWKDNERRKQDPYCRLEGFADAVETITAVSEDQANGQIQASCQAELHVRTIDETVIRPERVEISPAQLAVTGTVYKAGGHASKNLRIEGFDPVQLSASVFPALSQTPEYEPYDRSVVWSVSDEAVSITQSGELSVNPSAAWIVQALQNPPYVAEKTIEISARAGDAAAQGSVHLKLETVCLELETQETIDVEVKRTGRRSAPEYSWSGADKRILNAKTYPETRRISYQSSKPEILKVSEQGELSLVCDPQLSWLQPAWEQGKAVETVVNITAQDESGCKAVCSVRIRAKAQDLTTSGSSGGGGGGGGGGSSLGGGAVSKTVAAGPGADLPSYVVSGEWKEEQGVWKCFWNGAPFVDTWAAVANPYADPQKGQSRFDWFRFDGQGHMVTGWYQDTDGNRYYLNPVSDGTRGRMYTGWCWVDGNYCYFQEESDGFRGRLREGV